MVNQIIALCNIYNKTSSELVGLLNNKEYKKLKLRLNKTNGGKQVYNLMPKLPNLSLYIDFKLKDWANIIQTLPHLNKNIIDYNLESKLKDYISKIDGNELIKLKFKIKEGILSLIKKDQHSYLQNNLELKVKELLKDIRKTKRISFSELTKEEIKEIALKNINGIKAQELVEEYGLKSKSAVYQSKQYFKINKLDTINKLYLKSYKNLNKKDIIEIYKRNKIEKINSEELVNAYNLTNKSTVYKINKNMKNFFEGLNNLYYGPEEKIILLDNIISLDEYRNTA